MKKSEVLLIAGMAYGDECKGSVVDHIARKHGAHTIVRYNGGPNAGHNVVTDDGRHHTFAQFGSATFVPGVSTFISRWMVIDPLAFVNEERHLREVRVHDAFDRLFIDEKAAVVTPYHRAANKLREIHRSEGRHGSCGMGVGEAVLDYRTFGFECLLAGDLTDTDRIRRKLRFHRDEKRSQLGPILADVSKHEAARSELQVFEDEAVLDEIAERFHSFAKKTTIVNETYLRGLLACEGTTIFEGAQGVLLDQEYGFYPYVTRSDVTFRNAGHLLTDFFGKVTRIGVLRGNATRHGAGPFVTEDPEWTKRGLVGEHNGFGEWQQTFRVGHFDMVASRYALAALGGVDEIALTCLDALPERPYVCIGYDGVEKDPSLFEFVGSRAVGIRTRFPLRTTEQERITRALAKAKPHYIEVAGAQGLIDHIESESLPVTICSYGPAAKDKKERR